MVLLILPNIVGLFISARQKSAWCKWFVPQLYQLRRGISEGPALKYFYMIHRGGRMGPGSSWIPGQDQWQEMVRIELSPFQCWSQGALCELVFAIIPSDPAWCLFFAGQTPTHHPGRAVYIPLSLSLATTLPLACTLPSHTHIYPCSLSRSLSGSVSPLPPRLSLSLSLSLSPSRWHFLCFSVLQYACWCQCVCTCVCVGVCKLVCTSVCVCVFVSVFLFSFTYTLARSLPFTLSSHYLSRLLSHSDVLGWARPGGQKEEHSEKKNANSWQPRVDILVREKSTYAQTHVSVKK